MSSIENKVVAETTAWLETVVIQLNLCPFAKSIHVKNQIRYFVSSSTDSTSLSSELEQELQLLVNSDPNLIESSLIIHPDVLNDFGDYISFLELCNALLEDLELDGVIQVASFHPDYQFADTEYDDVTNYTNRSPYPMLHLLRESSITKALESFPNSEDIVNRNLETMNRMGRVKMDALLQAVIERSRNNDSNIS